MFCNAPADVGRDASVVSIVIAPQDVDREVIHCHGQSPLACGLFAAGYFDSNACGLTGRFSNVPPQFGHAPLSSPSTHDLQNVHSKLQITASSESGGKSRSHRSQFGLIDSIALRRCRRPVCRRKPETHPLLCSPDFLLCQTRSARYR